MGAGIAASPQCAERRICRCSSAWRPEGLLLLDPNSPAQASLRTVVVPGGTFSVFRGPSWANPPARRLLPERNRVPHWKRPTLPAPLTGWSEAILGPCPKALSFASLHRLPAEIGASVPSSHPPVVADFPGEAGTSVPITMSLCACPRVAQSGKSESLPVDNGDIGNNRRNGLALARIGHRHCLHRPPLLPRCKCLSPLPLCPSRPISPASIRRSARRC